METTKAAPVSAETTTANAPTEPAAQLVNALDDIATEILGPETALETGEQPSPEPSDNETESVLSQPEKAVEPEPSTDEQGDNDDTEQSEPELPEHTKAEIQKRIGREVAKRKALEEKLKELEAKLPKDEKPAEPAPVVKPTSLIDEHQAVKEAAKAESDARSNLNMAKQLSRQLNENPESVVQQLVQSKFLPPGANEEQAKAFLEAQADIWTDKLLDAKADVKMRRAQVEQEIQNARQASVTKAVEQHPWLKDQQSQEYQRASQIAAAMESRYKGIMADPAAIAFVALAVEGERALASKAKPAATAAAPAAKPVAKPPPKLGGGSAKPAVTNGGGGSGSAAFERFRKEQTPEAAEAALVDILN